LSGLPICPRGDRCDRAPLIRASPDGSQGGRTRPAVPRRERSALSPQSEGADSVEAYSGILLRAATGYSPPIGGHDASWPGAIVYWRRRPNALPHAGSRGPIRVAIEKIVQLVGSTAELLTLTSVQHQIGQAELRGGERGVVWAPHRLAVILAGLVRVPPIKNAADRREAGKR
jgi:hypothetical protein